MAKLLSTVKRLWTTKPLLVNCVTYGTLYGAAELSQQCLIRKAFVSKQSIYSNNIYSTNMSKSKMTQKSIYTAIDNSTFLFRV